MQLVHFPFPCRGRSEGIVELSQIMRLNHDMKLADRIGAQAQFAAHHPPGLNPPLVFHTVQKSRQRRGKGPFVGVGLQVEPDMIDIHCKSLANSLPDGPVFYT